MSVVPVEKKADGQGLYQALQSLPGHERWTQNEELQRFVKEALPNHYQFEVAKTLARLERSSAEHVVLQFPEGLLVWSDTIAHILQYFLTGLEITIMGDVTYGACCIDDVLAQTLGADFLVHYGHSCLVPITETTGIETLYVFVDIQFDTEHLLKTIRRNFRPEDDAWGRSLALLGTIQYASVVFQIKSALIEEYASSDKHIVIPQSAPLSSGEVLGCTSPIFKSGSTPPSSSGCSCSQEGSGVGTPKDLEDAAFEGTSDAQERDLGPEVDVVVFLCDGRFHLESAMIQNPDTVFFKYDPFSKRLTRERYDHRRMKALRWDAITQFRTEISSLSSNPQADEAHSATSSAIGVLQSTLGRQGSVGLAESMSAILTSRVGCGNSSSHNPSPITFTLLSSELAPHRVELLKKAGLKAMIQIACPRMSIDWGHGYAVPVLSPYEASVAFGLADWRSVYPMDFYSERKNPWSNRGVIGGRMGSQKNLYQELGGNTDMKSRLRAKLEARKRLAEQKTS